MVDYETIYNALSDQEAGYEMQADSCGTRSQERRLRRLAAVAIILRDNLLKDGVSEDRVQIGLSLEEVIDELKRSPNIDELGGLSRSSVYPVILQLQIATKTTYELRK